jgi:hypothetical protein
LIAIAATKRIGNVATRTTLATTMSSTRLIATRTRVAIRVSRHSPNPGAPFRGPPDLVYPYPPLRLRCSASPAPSGYATARLEADVEVEIEETVAAQRLPEGASVDVARRVRRV